MKKEKKSRENSRKAKTFNKSNYKPKPFRVVLKGNKRDYKFTSIFDNLKIKNEKLSMDYTLNSFKDYQNLVKRTTEKILYPPDITYDYSPQFAISLRKDMDCYLSKFNENDSNVILVKNGSTVGAYFSRRKYRINMDKYASVFGSIVLVSGKFRYRIYIETNAQVKLDIGFCNIKYLNDVQKDLKFTSIKDFFKEKEKGFGFSLKSCDKIKNGSIVGKEILHHKDYIDICVDMNEKAMYIFYNEKLKFIKENLPFEIGPNIGYIPVFSLGHLTRFTVSFEPFKNGTYFNNDFKDFKNMKSTCEDECMPYFKEIKKICRKLFFLFSKINEKFDIVNEEKGDEFEEIDKVFIFEPIMNSINCTNINKLIIIKTILTSKTIEKNYGLKMIFNFLHIYMDFSYDKVKEMCFVVQCLVEALIDKPSKFISIFSLILSKYSDLIIYVYKNPRRKKEFLTIFKHLIMFSHMKYDIVIPEEIHPVIDSKNNKEIFENLNKNLDKIRLIKEKYQSQYKEYIESFSLLYITIFSYLDKYDFLTIDFLKMIDNCDYYSTNEEDCQTDKMIILRNTIFPMINIINQLGYSSIKIDFWLKYDESDGEKLGGSLQYLKEAFDNVLSNYKEESMEKSEQASLIFCYIAQAFYTRINSKDYIFDLYLSILNENVVNDEDNSKNIISSYYTEAFKSIYFEFEEFNLIIDFHIQTLYLFSFYHSKQLLYFFPEKFVMNFLINSLHFFSELKKKYRKYMERMNLTKKANKIFKEIFDFTLNLTRDKAIKKKSIRVKLLSLLEKILEEGMIIELLEEKNYVDFVESLNEIFYDAEWSLETGHIFESILNEISGNIIVLKHVGYLKTLLLLLRNNENFRMQIFEMLFSNAKSKLSDVNEAFSEYKFLNKRNHPQGAEVRLGEIREEFLKKNNNINFKDENTLKNANSINNHLFSSLSNDISNINDSNNINNSNNDIIIDDNHNSNDNNSISINNSISNNSTNSNNNSIYNSNNNVNNTNVRRNNPFNDFGINFGVFRDRDNSNLSIIRIIENNNNILNDNNSLGAIRINRVNNNIIDNNELIIFRRGEFLRAFPMERAINFIGIMEAIEREFNDLYLRPFKINSSPHFSIMPNLKDNKNVYYSENLEAEVGSIRKQREKLTKSLERFNYELHNIIKVFEHINLEQICEVNCESFKMYCNFLNLLSISLFKDRDIKNYKDDMSENINPYSNYIEIYRKVSKNVFEVILISLKDILKGKNRKKNYNNDNLIKYFSRNFDYFNLSKLAKVALETELIPDKTKKDFLICVKHLKEIKDKEIQNNINSINIIEQNYENNICTICYNNYINISIIPCKHELCKICFGIIMKNTEKCPFCRKDIKGKKDLK